MNICIKKVVRSLHVIIISVFNYVYLILLIYFLFVQYISACTVC